MVDSAAMPKKVNWSSQPRSTRKRPILEGCTVAPEVLEALRAFVVERNRKKSEVVESALREYLGMEKADKSG